MTGAIKTKAAGFSKGGLKDLFMQNAILIVILCIIVGIIIILAVLMDQARDLIIGRAEAE